MAVIPAQAGIHSPSYGKCKKELDSRLRGNDGATPVGWGLPGLRPAQRIY
jgi:hypothetical protein